METEYVDFEDTNVVWGWTKDNDEYEFNKIYLNNAIAGDTDSVMMSLNGIVTEEDDINDIVELADTIAKKTNDSFPEFIQKAFNCPSSRKDVVTTDREIISDKSFFLTKKRYVMHVVNDEGKEVDKLKIMGVEIKKSDTPVAVKEMLMEMVNMILDDADINQMKERIKEAAIMLGMDPESGINEFFEKMDETLDYLEEIADE